MLGDDLPDGQDASDQEGAGPVDPPLERSLGDDIGALIDDGKTYVEAELAFQKTRISFVADNGKSGLVYVLAALAFLHLALIGLVVGGIFALSPLVGAGWATAAVVGFLLIGVAFFGLLAKKRFSEAASAFQDDEA